MQSFLSVNKVKLTLNDIRTGTFHELLVAYSTAFVFASHGEPDRISS